MGRSRKKYNRKNKRKKEMSEKKPAFMGKSIVEKHLERTNEKTYNGYGQYGYHNQSVAPNLEISKTERDSAIRLMRSIFEVQSDSYQEQDMKIFLLRFLDKLQRENPNHHYECNTDEKGNVYWTKGIAETYPCIVSHIDTVHNIIPDQDYVVLNSNTEFFAINLKSRGATGIGGDDKCGIYTCLDNFIREDYIKVAFFVEEEVGCGGSQDCDMDFFKDVSFVFQADRKGYEDVAVSIMGTEMFDDEFYIKALGVFDEYKRDVCDGGMTDVMQLAHNGLDVAMANFSCGYYNPHTDREYVVIDELILTSILFRDLIRVAYVDGERNVFERPVDNYNYYGGWGNTYYSTKDKEVDKPSYSELDSDDDGMSSSTHIHSKSIGGREDTSCSYCGQPTMYDATMEMNYCNNCMDYDYNSAVRR